MLEDDFVDVSRFQLNNTPGTLTKIVFEIDENHA